MPKKGNQYPVDAAWKDRVRRRIAELGISQNELGKRAKISKAALSDALSKESLQSACVPEIHRVLGWPTPPLVLGLDTLELIHMYVQLDDFERGSIMERARSRLADLRKRGRKPD